MTDSLDRQTKAALERALYRFGMTLWAAGMLKGGRRVVVHSRIDKSTPLKVKLFRDLKAPPIHHEEPVVPPPQQPTIKPDDAVLYDNVCDWCGALLRNVKFDDLVFCRACNNRFLKRVSVLHAAYLQRLRQSLRDNPRNPSENCITTPTGCQGGLQAGKPPCAHDPESDWRTFQ